MLLKVTLSMPRIWPLDSGSLSYMQYTFPIFYLELNGDVSTPFFMAINGDLVISAGSSQRRSSRAFPLCPGLYWLLKMTILTQSNAGTLMMELRQINRNQLQALAVIQQQGPTLGLNKSVN